MRCQRSAKWLLSGIMIGFIADKSAIPIVRKCYAKAHEMKNAWADSWLAEGNITVHAAALEQIFAIAIGESG